MKNLQFKQCHFFKKGPKYFLFVVDTLRLFQLEQGVYNKIKTLYNQTLGLSSFEHKRTPLLEELLAEEIVCNSELIKEVKDVIKKEKDRLNEKEKYNDNIYLTNVVLQVANDCNLHCKYCYGDGGSYGRKRELMDFETAQKGIDYLVTHRGERKYLRVTFFGGEPLLNFDLIKRVIAYCCQIEKQEGIKFSYNMTTNGTIISDEILEYIQKYRFSLLISMDGGKSTQDCYRCYADGKGSFDTILQNLKLFKKAHHGKLSVRATVCKPNMDMVSIRKELMNIGFDNVIMSMVDTQNTSFLFLGDETEAMKKEYSRLADELIKDAKSGNGINNTMFNEILRKLYYKILSIKSCNAGSTGFAIGSDGNFYPCHRYMGMEDYVCGSVDQGIDLSKTAIYKHANIFKKDDCKNCWARYLCGGACSNICVTQSNDAMKAPTCYCEIYKCIYENALYIYYELKSWDENYFRKILEKDKETVPTIK